MVKSAFLLIMYFSKREKGFNFGQPTAHAVILLALNTSINLTSQMECFQSLLDFCSTSPYGKEHVEDVWKGETHKKIKSIN